ncbi:MFS transporter [Conexibacter sp. DBS9H8]|uniref:MFS transporter n=1 Tax=Conexibacter sp. DBS9H8 TaxID=2937801 RepID=UPI00200F7464|nr:MFS transporter [Conexibacter sp. DBS9H8]
MRRLTSLSPLGWEGPLAGSYWSAVTMVIAALTPFLVLSAAVDPLQAAISHAVHLTGAGLEMNAGMADAAYCFGTILAVQLTSRLPGRRLLALYALVFTLASVLTALSASPVPFFIGRILQGMATSLMLITAAPALILAFPLARMRATAMVMNMGIFGAVAVGPVIGGAFVSLGDWRLLFWIAAAVGAVCFTLTLLTFRDQPPMDRELEFDFESLGLASVGCVAAFFGGSSLANHAFVSTIVLVPMALGLACLIGLIVHQASVADPLMPIRQLGHTVPIAAIALAMFAGAGSVALVGLLELTVVAHHVSSAVFWPEFGGAVLTAMLFGGLFFTRWVPALAFAGLVVLVGTGALLAGSTGGDTTLIVIGTAGLGLGVGASVAPGLFVAGFSLPSLQLPRIFALVEMLRGVAAFLTAPILIHVAETVGATPAAGIRTGTWIAAGLLGVGALLVLFLVLAGGFRLITPELEAWQAGGPPAIESPPLLARLRRGRRAGDPVAAGVGD